LALLHFASDPQRPRVRRRIHHARPCGPDREAGVRRDPKRHRIQTIERKFRRLPGKTKKRQTKPSDIDRVREDPVDVASRDQAAARRSARSNNSNRQSHTFCIENGLQLHHAAKLKVALERDLERIPRAPQRCEARGSPPDIRMEPCRPSRCLSFSRPRLCPGCARR
jgi:hypothetical protein